MIHEAIHALATKLRDKISSDACVDLRCTCIFLRELAAELDSIAESHHAEAVHRNEMMFA